MRKAVIVYYSMDGNTQQIAADLTAHKHWIAQVTDADRAAHQEFLARASQMPPDAWQHLIRITDSCVDCGICTEVCPSASICLEHGRAVHHPGNCQACLSCIHNCPEKAIGLTIPEKNSQARYRNEHIQLAEIICANRQLP